MTRQSNEPKIGNKMPDGTIYAGVSPDTGSPIYAMPTDAPLTLTFNEAADHAKKLNREKYLGYDDWRVPTKAELDALFDNRAAIGCFNAAEDDRSVRHAIEHPLEYPGWHWSSTPGHTGAFLSRQFSNGMSGHVIFLNRISLRLVRTEPPRVT